MIPTEKPTRPGTQNKNKGVTVKEKKYTPKNWKPYQPESHTPNQDLKK
jgi:hypothetical protein